MTLNKNIIKKQNLTKMEVGDLYLYVVKCTSLISKLDVEKI